MSDIVLRVENLSKQYRLGVVGSGTLRDDVSRWIAKARGKEDPTLKVGETNTLDTVDGEYIWALQDINFEVKQGEVLGIIGKNGAGKSTLLKILSKVTGPTTGQIKAKGRIASLLEVGTGMHPELTGRENIFLNGAILGMTKAEIRRKLDEIIDFAGIAKYVYTPVKRYSSGMRVRLGFAVAAFLEPEILIVDEVLAVGDAEFQKKAIGKMQDVSKGEGRTVLFVSHNMGSVKALCSRGIILQNGKLIYTSDNAEDAVKQYLNQNTINVRPKQEWTAETAPGNEFVKLLKYEVVNESNKNQEIFTHTDMTMSVEFLLLKDTNKRIDVSLHIFNANEDLVCVITSGLLEDVKKYQFQNGKIYRYQFNIPQNSFNQDTYHATFRVVENRANRALVKLDEIISFNVLCANKEGIARKFPGVFVPKYNLQITQTN